MEGLERKTLTPEEGGRPGVSVHPPDKPKKGSIGCAGEPIEPLGREKVVSRNGMLGRQPGEGVPKIHGLLTGLGSAWPQVCGHPEPFGSHLLG
jgi:hypothetical protein